MKSNIINYFANAKRVVIKVGSGVLTLSNSLNLNVIQSISRQISLLNDKGIEVILVSSGAMASGLKKMGFKSRPDEIPKRQAIAAIGQPGLMVEYEKAFSEYGKKVAQILLTTEDLCSRKRYLNARNTMYVLLSWKVVPIINENDTVATQEIKFGDNDNLSAMIALLMDADVLVNLTDIDGLYTKNPRVYKDAELISEVKKIGKDIETIAGSIPGALGTGGMLSKIKAAQKATSSGLPMIIAKGEKEDILLELFDGKKHGTLFLPKNQKPPRRKCWLAYAAKPKGTLVVDKGAENAVINNGKSLLPSGIISVSGDFNVGDPVAFHNIEGEKLGVGLANYSSTDVNKIKGLNSKIIAEQLGSKSYDEVIHRNNLALTNECNF
ncbi:MAG: glutamate 5-kinase [Desulfobacterales bacterium]|nr:glutamate 5-kinase [Desulfobacterales bacterium]